MQKNEVKALLQDYNIPELVAAGTRDRGLIRTLISLVYNKEDIMSWRAIEAIGCISGAIAATNPEVIRNLSQRLLWMLREESGNGPGSAPEMLGEIVRNSPDAFCDIAAIITSFHDEEMLRRGVFRAAWRVCEVRPDLVCLTHEMIGQNIYLEDPDPVVRGYALLIAGKLGLKEFLPLMEKLRDDTSPVRMYEDGRFVETKVAEIANNVYAGMSSGEN
jgi:hypothetical protein